LGFVGAELLKAGCLFCHPTNSIKALNAQTELNYYQVGSTGEK